jgi:hypothetical protein
MADESNAMKITGTTRGYGVNADVDLALQLSLRDLFAAFALAGMNAESVAVSDEAIRERARRAYKFADAALSARGTDE